MVRLHPDGPLFVGDQVATPGELEALLDPAWYTRHVPEVLERVAGL